METRVIPRPIIEALESRIAPAVIIAAGGKSASYTDLDGDRVTVTVSKGKLAKADFLMSTEGASVLGGEKLVMLDFSDDGKEFHGANVTITAKASKLGGNGVAEVDFINAANGLVDLGRVSVDGALGQVVAGDANDSVRSPGVKLLTAQSFGGSSYDVVGGIAKVVLTGTSGNAGAANIQVTPVGSITTTTGVLDSHTVGTAMETSIVAPGVSFTAVGGSLGLVKTGSGVVQITGSNTFSPSQGGASNQNPGSVVQISTPSYSSGTNTYTPGPPSGATLSFGSRSFELNYGSLTLNTGTQVVGDPMQNDRSDAVNVITTNGNGNGSTNLSMAGFSSITYKSYIGSTEGASVRLIPSGSSTIGAGGVLNMVKTGTGTVTLSNAAASATYSGLINTQSLPIVLENLDDQPPAAGVEATEIQVGDETLTIVQNVTVMNHIKTKGYVFSAPVFDDVGNLISITVCPPDANFLNVVNWAAAEKLALTQAIVGEVKMAPVQQPALPTVPLVPLITLPNIVLS